MFSDFIQPFELDPLTILANMWVATALLLLVCLAYRYTHKSEVYTRIVYFHFVICCLTMTMMVMLAWNGAWLALVMGAGMGVFRFHGWIRDNRDQLYMLLTSAGIGVSCGCGAWLVAISGTVLVCAVLLVVAYVQFDKGRNYQDYTLTFCVRSPADADAFVRAAPQLFTAAVLRSSGQIDTGVFEFVYGVRPRPPAQDDYLCVEDLVLVLRKEVAGITEISLVRPEAYNTGVEV